jgi:hypothetical protein
VPRWQQRQAALAPLHLHGSLAAVNLHLLKYPPETLKFLLSITEALLQQFMNTFQVFDANNNR